MESAAKRRYRALPLIASPLKHEGQDKGDKFPERRPSIIVFNGHDAEPPAFREKEEASSIELFFDLFFVANLTSFTTIHPIDDKQSEYSITVPLSIQTRLIIQ